MITTHTITEEERKYMIAIIDGVYKLTSILNKEVAEKGIIDEVTIKNMTERINANMTGIKKVLYIE